MNAIHEFFMQRAVVLAYKGIREAYPNPSVGAVVVCDGKIIGEGYTSAYGGAHAEVNAINSVKDVALLCRSTLYVTLEPCSHYGKTPPCAKLIEAKKIPKIHIGCMDTYSEVSGKGIEILVQAGCEVHVGTLEQACIELHKRFLTYHNKQRPYVVLKWAQTQDGFMDVYREVTSKQQAQPTWISNTLSRQQVHQLRSVEHAIMVGTKTALKDNPTLTTRSVEGKSPIRILLDRTLKVPTDYHLYDGTVETLVFTENPSNLATVTYIVVDFSKPVLLQILKELYKRKIQSVLVEGGRQLLISFIQEEFWDEAWVFVGDTKFKNGILAPNLNLQPASKVSLKEDVLTHYKR